MRIKATRFLELLNEIDIFIMSFGKEKIPDIAGFEFEASAIYGELCAQSDEAAKYFHDRYHKIEGFLNSLYPIIDGKVSKIPLRHAWCNQEFHGKIESVPVYLSQLQTEELLSKVWALQSWLAKMTNPTTPDNENKGTNTDSQELERLRAFAQLSKTDAIRAVCSQFGTLPESVIIAGWNHSKGMSWAAMTKASKCSKSTLSARIKQFYDVTGWPKANWRMGKGKRYQFDENRDAGSM